MLRKVAYGGSKPVTAAVVQMAVTCQYRPTYGNLADMYCPQKTFADKREIIHEADILAFKMTIRNIIQMFPIYPLLVEHSVIAEHTDPSIYGVFTQLTQCIIA